MSIACYPLEPDDTLRSPPPAPVQAPEPVPVAAPSFFEGETSECNYLVLVFVVGVLFLAFTDSMRR
jgi:hypothetical protein